MANVKEALLTRTDIANEDVEQIIARAQRLQEDANQKARGISSEDVKDIASELQIDPRFVEAAISQLKEEREEQRKAAERQAKEAEAKRKEQEARRKKLLVGAGASLVGLLALLFLLALTGSGAANDAHLAASKSRGNVEAVLTRHANLAPQMLSLSGGDPKKIAPLVGKLQEEKSIEAKLKAFEELNTALSIEIAALPAASTPEATTQRQELRFQLEGAQNRVSTELKRYNEAKANWESETSSLTGKLAVFFGLASGEAP